MLFFKIEKDIDKAIDKNENNLPISKSQSPQLDVFRQFIFHCIPERTFNIRRYYLPICSRYIRFFIANFSYFIFVYMYNVQYNALLIIIDILMIIPTFLDGFYSVNWNKRK